jgi:hypothetical protein
LGVFVVSGRLRQAARRRPHPGHARFLEACDPGPEALLFEAAALLRWSSLPFRDVEPGWREAVARRVELARVRLRDYERRSASSVITAS